MRSLSLFMFTNDHKLKDNIKITLNGEYEREKLHILASLQSTAYLQIISTICKTGPSTTTMFFVVKLLEGFFFF